MYGICSAVDGYILIQSVQTKQKNCPDIWIQKNQTKNATHNYRCHKKFKKKFLFSFVEQFQRFIIFQPFQFVYLQRGGGITTYHYTVQSTIYRYIFCSSVLNEVRVIVCCNDRSRFKFWLQKIQKT